MYKVLVDDKVLCDSRIDELAIIDPVIELEVNTVEQFSFTLPSTHPRQDLIKIRTSIITVYRDDEIVFRGIAVSESVDFYKQKTYECEGVLTFLNDSIQRPAYYSGLTVLELLTSYISSHNQQVEDWKRFEIGNVTVTDPNNYISCYTNYIDTMTEIKEDMVDDLGGFLRTRYENGKNYIDYLAESPHDATQVIELGKNLLDYKSNLSTMTIATRVIPLGAQLEEQVIEGLNTRLTIESVNGGIDYIESSLVDTYGTISVTVEFDNVTTADALLTKGKKYLSEIQFENVTIEATAIDFGYLSKDIQKFKLLDKVHIISEPHGMDRWFLLSKMTMNLNYPENDRFTFGMDGIKSLTAQTKTANNSLLKAIEKITPESDLLKMAKEQATALICGTDGGYVVLNVNDDGIPYEILVMDKPTKEQATKVWRWNQNGLGYSRTGYNGEYGLAMTMDGKIVADYIASGTMYADRIKGGTLTLGGASNANGAAYVKDANGNVLVTLDKEGITLADSVRLLANNIKSGTLKLGGSESNPADLIIYNQENKVVGEWNEEGIYMTSFDYVPGQYPTELGDKSIINSEFEPIYDSSGEVYLGDAYRFEGYKSIDHLDVYIANADENVTVTITIVTQTVVDNVNYTYNHFSFDVNTSDMKKTSQRNIRVYTISNSTLNLTGIGRDEGTTIISTTSVCKVLTGKKITSITGSYIPVIETVDSNSTCQIERIEYIGADGELLTSHANYLTENETGSIFDFTKSRFKTENVTIKNDGIAITDKALIYGVEQSSEDGRYVENLKFALDNEGFTHKSLYNNVSSTSDAKALYITSAGKVVSTSSSQRYKTDINYNLARYNFDALYNLPIAEYRYREEFGGGDLEIGFIAEEIANRFPAAATFNEDGIVESWDERKMIPAMLKLIQDQNERLKILEEVLLDGRH